jgi:hypothetical protein
MREMIARLFRKIGGFVGIAMLAIGIAALIILVCQFHSCGWTDPRIISLGIAAVVLIGTFFARMSRWFRRRERLFLYFIFLIAIVGNLGTLVTLGQFVLGGTGTYLAVLKSFATYTIAVAAISFADRLMQPPEDHADNRTLLLRWFGVAIISIGAGVLFPHIRTEKIPAGDRES